MFDVVLQTLIIKLQIVLPYFNQAVPPRVLNFCNTISVLNIENRQMFETYYIIFGCRLSIEIVDYSKNKIILQKWTISHQSALVTLHSFRYFFYFLHKKRSPARDVLLEYFSTA